MLVRVFLAWALAYGLAALAGSTVMLLVIGIAFQDLTGLAILPLTVPVVALFALPGFLLLRPVLYYLYLRHVVWFAAFGALAAWGPSIVGVLVRGPVSLQGDGLMLAALAAAGATAGACYRMIERSALHSREVAA
jgi:hypothetical protein